jgi:hypothetical protein
MALLRCGRWCRHGYRDAVALPACEPGGQHGGDVGHAAGSGREGLGCSDDVGSGGIDVTRGGDGADGREGAGPAALGQADAIGGAARHGGDGLRDACGRGDGREGPGGGAPDDGPWCAGAWKVGIPAVERDGGGGCRFAHEAAAEVDTGQVVIVSGVGDSEGRLLCCNAGGEEHHQVEESGRWYLHDARAVVDSPRQK